MSVKAFITFLCHFTSDFPHTARPTTFRIRPPLPFRTRSPWSLEFGLSLSLSLSLSLRSGKNVQGETSLPITPMQDKPKWVHDKQFDDVFMNFGMGTVTWVGSWVAFVWWKGLVLPYENGSSHVIPMASCSLPKWLYFYFLFSFSSFFFFFFHFVIINSVTCCLLFQSK